MTVKETLVEALREEGWGFMEACDIVKRRIQEFPASSNRKTNFHSATGTFALRKKNPPRPPGRSGCGSAGRRLS